VADSPSETAKAIFDDIRPRVDPRERTAHPAHYVGVRQWILLKPPTSGMGAWCGSCGDGAVARRRRLALAFRAGGGNRPGRHRRGPGLVEAAQRRTAQ